MSFITYHNVANPHVTIHAAGCGHIAKHGGEHAHGNGWYEQHNTYAKATARAKENGLPVRDCSFCKPGSNVARRSRGEDIHIRVLPPQSDLAGQMTRTFDSHRERLLQAIEMAHAVY